MFRHDCRQANSSLPKEINSLRNEYPHKLRTEPLCFYCRSTRSQFPGRCSRRLSLPQAHARLAVSALRVMMTDPPPPINPTPLSSPFLLGPHRIHPPHRYRA